MLLKSDYYTKLGEEVREEFFPKLEWLESDKVESLYKRIMKQYKRQKYSVLHPDGIEIVHLGGINYEVRAL